MMREVLNELIIFIKAICLSASVFVVIKIIFGLAEWGAWFMKLKRWWFQSKKSLRHFIKTKDVEHLKDIWRLTKYYAQK